MGAVQGPETAVPIGQGLPVLAVLPFVLLLLGIAVLPLAFERWWESHRHKGIVAAALAVPVALYLTVAWGPEGRFLLAETMLDYVSFIILLAALFVISGGIHIRGSLAGTPLGNTTMLGIGAVLANVFGTTGAAMVLIRPLLRANHSRERKAHLVIFFIFIVANCGGLLTPLGDPPLFVGYLEGVPFTWTLRLWPQWLLANGILLLLFMIGDQRVLDREELERPGSQLEAAMRHEPFAVRGAHNFAFLLGIVLVIVAAGWGIGNHGEPWPFGVKEVLMVALTVAAYASTHPHHRAANAFVFGPIIEVAVLFAGIFVTMAPALAILNAWGQGQREVLGLGLGLSQPWQFFWTAGGLSSVVDNTPTYLTFSATAAGIGGVPATGRFLAPLLATGPAAAKMLAAIATGAVFMGANTYIGNGPNFMVKAVAEHHGVRMPSFFGYLAYSLAVLIPVFVIVTFVFFRS
jgi:Na+/H+ antiporter NhaD/arsenite permease-like protein